ncbi:MAG: DNA polymerase III subunit delta [Bacteriovoracaceae bacterium]|nr:DNA polymerase III subunit delta [Bacteroidota bacterium]
MAKSKEKLDMEQFVSSFKKRQFAPCYLFCGDEKYPIDLIIDALVEYAIDPSIREFNLDMIHGNEIDGKKIVSIASSYPMMAERRVVIIKDFDRVNGKDVLDPYIEHPSATTVLAVIANNPDFRKKPYVTFKKAGYVHESRSWYDNETVAWIEARVKKINSTIEPAAVQLLHSYVGNNLRELANELEKVVIAHGNAPKISAAHIEKVVGISREFTSFQLCDRIGEKNMPKALEIAQRMISSGESIVGLIAAITNHFVRLWKLQDAVQQRKSEQEMLQYVYFNSFALKGSLTQLRNYKPAELEHVFILLAEADLVSKSSGDPRLIITTLIAEIIAGSSTRMGAVL